MSAVYLCILFENTAADIPVEEKTDSEERWMSGLGRGREGGQERETTRGDCNSSLSEMEKKKKSNMVP